MGHGSLLQDIGGTISKHLWARGCNGTADLMSVSRRWQGGCPQPGYNSVLDGNHSVSPPRSGRGLANCCGAPDTDCSGRSRRGPRRAPPSGDPSLSGSSSPHPPVMLLSSDTACFRPSLVEGRERKKKKRNPHRSRNYVRAHVHGQSSPTRGSMQIGFGLRIIAQSYQYITGKLARSITCRGPYTIRP